MAVAVQPDRDLFVAAREPEHVRVERSWRDRLWWKGEGGRHGLRRRSRLDVCTVFFSSRAVRDTWQDAGTLFSNFVQLASGTAAGSPKCWNDCQVFHFEQATVVPMPAVVDDLVDTLAEHVLCHREHLEITV